MIYEFEVEGKVVGKQRPRVNMNTGMVYTPNKTKDYEYFALYSQNKWGVINQEGEEVIQPSYQEMIVIPDKTKDVFICTYNVNEETGTYQTKAINSKNEDILIGYDQIEALENMDENDNVFLLLQPEKLVIFLNLCCIRIFLITIYSLVYLYMKT